MKYILHIDFGAYNTTETFDTHDAAVDKGYWTARFCEGICPVGYYVEEVSE